MGNTVRFSATLNDQVSGRLAKIRDNFDRLGKTKGAMSILQGVGIGAGISAWGLLDRAISGAVNVMGDAIKGAIEEEKSIAHLTTALKANVAGWDGRTAALEDVFNAQLKLGFSDEEQRDSMALLVAATGNVAKALEVQRTAMDLARFKGISLAEATEALTKVEAGSYRILKSLGIELKKGATATEALAAVQKVAAGQAADYADTLEGRALAATIRFDEKMEDLGKKALPLVSSALDVVTESMDDLDRAAAGDAGGVADLWVTLMKLNPALWATQLAADKLGSEIEDTAEQANELKVIGYHVANATKATEDLTHGFRGVKKEAHGAAYEIGNVEQAMRDLTNALYGPEELEGAVAEAEQAVIDARKALDKFNETPASTPKQKRDLQILEGNLARAKRELIEAQTEWLALDGLTLTEARQQMDKLGRAADGLNTNLAAVLRRLRKINDIWMVTPSGTGPTERASGGPVSPFGVYSVGESGPETLVMGARGGFVIPGAEGHSGGGGGMVTVPITVTVDGDVVYRSVERRQLARLRTTPVSV